MTNILHSNLHIFWLFSCFLQKILIIASICSVQKYNEKKNNRILVIFITTLFLFWILLLFDRKNNFYPFSVPSSSIPFISIQFHSIYAIQFIRNGARFLLHWLQNSEWINLCELLNFDDGKDIIFFFLSFNWNVIAYSRISDSRTRKELLFPYDRTNAIEILWFRFDNVSHKFLSWIPFSLDSDLHPAFIQFFFKHWWD